MPRIVYILIFLVVTLAPFPVIWLGQYLIGTNKDPAAQNTTQQSTGSNYQRDHYYHRPFYGGFFYYGSRGRGGWLGKSYSSSRKSFGGSRSYSGGSSFGGGGFGSFGK